jgi:hypothetical protein
VISLLALYGSPFFQRTRVKAASLRAMVKRANSGFMPCSSRLLKESRHGPGRRQARSAALLKISLGIVVVILIQATNGNRFATLLELAIHQAIVRAGASDQGEAGISPGLTLGSEAMRRLHQS